MHLSLDKITIDAGTQGRVKLDKKVIEDYAEKMKLGEIFPPCVVISDGKKNYLVNGFHRYFAARKIKSPSLDCNVTEGTLQQAKERSWAANSDHGLPRTRGDKRKCVLSAINDDTHRGKSDREIAVLCKVSHTFVQNVRKELKEVAENISQPPVTAEKEVATLPPEDEENDVFQEEMEATIELLKAENEALSDKLAVASMDADDLDKAMAESTIKDLRAQIRLLEIELKTVTESRDSFQRENAQLMKQVNSLTNKLKKLQA
jgi:ParB-like chromosome segregation protein Spo0J